MNSFLNFLAEILAIAADVTKGAISGDLKAADALVLIIQKGIAEYQAQTGQAIDPALIKPFTPIA